MIGRTSAWRRAPRRWDVVVVGSATIDVVVHGGDRPHADRVEEGHTSVEAVGGKGANLAVAAARLGARVAFVGCVGVDARGDRVLRRLVDEGVDIGRVVRDPDAATSTVAIHVDRSGETQSVRVAGAAERLSWADVQRARALLRDTYVVACVRAVPDAVLETAAALARLAGATVYLDVATPAPISDELLRLTDIVRASARETEAVTGRPVGDERSACTAAAVLCGRGARVAMVAAPDGNGVLSKDGWQWMPKHAVEVADTTGAGDAFGGALSAELAQEATLGDAAAVANAAAALATTRLGGMDAQATRDEVMKLLRRAPDPMA